MADLKGDFSFPGLNSIRKADYTLTHGVTPSVALVELLPQEITNIHGTMLFSYGNTTISLPGSKIISSTVRKTGGGWVMVVKIADRRWKFSETGEISGVFNLRKEDESIDSATEKTPQQIATLCFQAMGEFSFSISALPNLSRPEMILEHENPAQVLSGLCDDLGCRVVLGTDNRIRVERTGVGAALPTAFIMSPSFSADIPDIPDSIKVVGGKNRYQSRWTLEAVGEDTDRSIKPIDDLSYTPAKGWNKTSSPNQPSVLKEFGKKAHQLAKKTVHRWYRITETTGGDGLTFRSQALPIETALIDVYTDDNGEDRQQQAVVRGVYWLRNSQTLIGAENSSKTDFYDESFSINAKEGIVQFNESLVKASQSNNDLDTESAEMTLEVAYSVQGILTKAWKRAERESTIAAPARGTGPLIVKRDDLVQTHKSLYDGSGNFAGLDSNFPQTEMNDVITAKLQEFQVVKAFTADYPGIVNISPDGAIRQVSWSVAQGVASVTRAGLNTEVDASIPRFRAAREREKLPETQKKAKELDHRNKVNIRRFRR